MSILTKCVTCRLRNHFSKVLQIFAPSDKIFKYFSRSCKQRRFRWHNFFWQIGLRFSALNDIWWKNGFSIQRKSLFCKALLCIPCPSTMKCSKQCNLFMKTDTVFCKKSLLQSYAIHLSL